MRITVRVRTFLSLLCGVRTTTTTTVVVRTLLWCGYSLLYLPIRVFIYFYEICSCSLKLTFILISSQSQCGHSESGKKYHNSRQNTISYISNTGATITSEHQMALALALANTEGYISQVKIQLFLTYE